jgi:hypothetical protein
LATYIRDLIRNNNLDFVCFQETMVKDLSKACLRGVDPGKDYLWDQIRTKGKSGGIVTGIKLDSFDVGCRVQGEFILQHLVCDKKLNVKWNLLNVYGAAHDVDKEAFLIELASFCSKNKDPYLIGVTSIY